MGIDAIYQWAGTIVSYLVFVTVLSGLLPAARYEKYLRLFAGCVLILLVFQPLTKGLRLEESIQELFRSLTFENEAKELTGKLDAMEEKRLRLLVEKYESEVETEVKRLGEADGILVRSARVWVEDQPESPEFARIRRIVLECSRPQAEETMLEYRWPRAEGTEEYERLSKDGEKNREEKSPGEITVDAAAHVAMEEISVHIDREGGEKEAGKYGQEVMAGEKKDGMINPETSVAASAESQEKLEEFKKRLASYYQVEEAYVEIRMEAGEEPDTGQGEMADSAD